MREADIEETATGRVPAGDGWFILNLAELSWETVPGSGTWCVFEGPGARSATLGIGVHVLQPGEPSAMYHAESEQEGFLVLAGECLAVIDGQEQPLRQWDYFHCPPGTRHVLVGAGDGPCAVLMVGAPRSASLSEILYPRDPVAERYGASATETTRSSKRAYADRTYAAGPVRAPWPESG
jgi:uncharacterized cupin superfamily protein